MNTNITKYTWLHHTDWFVTWAALDGSCKTQNVHRCQSSSSPYTTMNRRADFTCRFKSRHVTAGSRCKGDSERRGNWFTIKQWLKSPETFTASRLRCWQVSSHTWTGPQWTQCVCLPPGGQLCQLCDPFASFAMIQTVTQHNPPGRRNTRIFHSYRFGGSIPGSTSHPHVKAPLGKTHTVLLPAPRTAALSPLLCVNRWIYNLQELFPTLGSSSKERERTCSIYRY